MRKWHVVGVILIIIFVIFLHSFVFGGEIFGVDSTATQNAEKPLFGAVKGETKEGFPLSESVFKETFVDPFVHFFANDNSTSLTRDSDTSSAFIPREQEKNDFRPLTPEEVSSFVWPAEYKRHLFSIQEILAQEGFLSVSETFSLETDEEIFALLLRLVDYMEDKKHITSEQAVQFRSTLRGELPDLIAEERAALESRFIKNRDSEHGAVSDDRNAYLSAMRLVEYFRYVGSINSAYAQGAGTCELALNLAPTTIVPSTPIGEIEGGCYKDNDPFFFVCGFNTFAPCCNCSIGPVPVGCLNGVCAAWPNAIWDEDTGICGCG